MKKHQKLMLRYGGIMGGASIVLTMLQYTLGAYNGKPLTDFLFGILPILLLSFFIFLGIYQSKERSFRQMMKMGLGISIFFAVIAAIFWIVFIKYIAPTHLDTLNNLQLEAYKGQHPEVDAQTIEQMRTTMEDNKSPWIQFNLSVVSNMFFGLIISLLASSIFKLYNRN